MVNHTGPVMGKRIYYIKTMSMKRMLLVTFLLLQIITGSCQVIEKKYSVRKINAYGLSETLKESNKMLLLKKIAFEYDTICIKAVYNLNDSDFSFYYPELLDTVTISINKENIPFSIKEYAPTIQNYLIGYEFVNIIQNDNSKYILIFGRPFFCNGYNCSDISVLVISIMGTSKYCFEINTSFCDENFLMLKINDYLKTKKQFCIPIIDDCKKKYKLKKLIPATRFGRVSSVP